VRLVVTISKQAYGTKRAVACSIFHIRDEITNKSAIESGRRHAVAVLKPRERLVYFRISEDEFRQFVGVCEQEGARSVSDLARTAIQRLIAGGDRQRNGEELTQKMERLENLIAALTQQLQLLTVSGTHNAPMVAATAQNGPTVQPNRREE
jgi:hypothetical protein